MSPQVPQTQSKSNLFFPLKYVAPSIPCCSINGTPSATSSKLEQNTIHSLHVGTGLSEVSPPIRNLLHPGPHRVSPGSPELFIMYLASYVFPFI